MCFSAAASFSVAALTGLTGVAAIRQVATPRELPLAATPLLFAFQQIAEGLLWLRLTDPDPGFSTVPLSFTFLLFAEVIWPAYTGVAVLLIEPAPRRRYALKGIIAIGLVLAGELLRELLADLPMAEVSGRSIAYGRYAAPLSLDHIPYLAATMLPLLISSHGAIRIFGILMSAGFLVSAYVYTETFVSVWCFFAAAASIMLYLYFPRAVLKALSR